MHGLPSLQSSAPVPTHALFAQVSPVVQLSLSLHASVLAVKAHAPATESHASLVHALPSAQRCAVPWQLPATHASLSVQKLLSVQAPLFMGVLLQPDVGLHTSAVHGLLSAHVALFTVPAHALLVQTSFTVQATPSSHAIVFAVLTQPVATLQVSVVHRLLSLQLSVAPLHVLLASHTSAVVHALPSLQGAPSPSGVYTQPVPTAQVSVVHGLLSLQTWPTPLQLAPTHTSLVVHGLPSSQATAKAVAV